MEKITSVAIINQLKNSTDSLKFILVGLYVIIIQQQQEIANLKNSISNLTPIDKFNTSVNEITMQVQDMKTFFSFEFYQYYNNKRQN